jgi:hypothetical protein
VYVLYTYTDQCWYRYNTGIAVDNHVDTKLAYLKEPMVSIVLSCCCST